MNTVQGDLLALAQEGRFDVIVHGCNCQCKMGRGIAKQIRWHFPDAYIADLRTPKGSREKLGTYSSATISHEAVHFVVVNAYTQFDWHGQGVLVDYDAVRRVFHAIKTVFHGQRIGYPRIGAGLAHGDWPTIAAIIDEALAGEDHTLVEFDPSVQHESNQTGASMPQTINFYRVNEEYGCFSNFAPYPICLDGKRWPTSEHYFQAQKFEDSQAREAIRETPSPMIAARMGRSRKLKLRRDWESVKVAIMTDALRAKFAQHPELAVMLLNTGDALIVEHTENDDYWGDGGDGSGKNMLGQILMGIRAGLRHDKNT